MTRTTIERRALLRLAALAFAPTAAGCSSLIPGTGTPPQLYVLMRKTTFPPDLPSISRQLLVSTPIAPAEIDTTRVDDVNLTFRSLPTPAAATVRIFNSPLHQERAVMSTALYGQDSYTHGRFNLIGGIRWERVEGYLPAQATPKLLAPLPIFGYPGWLPGNDQQAFYEDERYFRPFRHDKIAAGVGQAAAVRNASRAEESPGSAERDAG